jgi:hypothetical protein
MKNIFKIPLLALSVSFSAAGCEGNRARSSADSTKVDSSKSIKSYTDTTGKGDTSKKKTDTVSKTSTTTQVKKTEIKKHK